MLDGKFVQTHDQALNSTLPLRVHLRIPLRMQGKKELESEKIFWLDSKLRGIRGALTHQA